MLKWTVLYNSSFSNNHKTLFEEVLKLQEEGRLEAVKQCDFVKNRANIKKLLSCEPLHNLLTPKTWNSLTPETPMRSVEDMIMKNPKKTLRSVISLWDYDLWNEFTRVDIGEVELKYLIESERRLPKWNSK